MLIRPPAKNLFNAKQSCIEENSTNLEMVRHFFSKHYKAPQPYLSLKALQKTLNTRGFRLGQSAIRCVRTHQLRAPAQRFSIHICLIESKLYVRTPKRVIHAFITRNTSKTERSRPDSIFSLRHMKCHV